METNVMKYRPGTQHSVVIRYDTRSRCIRVWKEWRMSNSEYRIEFDILNACFRYAEDMAPCEQVK